MFPFPDVKSFDCRILGQRVLEIRKVHEHLFGNDQSLLNLPETQGVLLGLTFLCQELKLAQKCSEFTFAG